VKVFNIISHQGKCKLNPPRDTTIHPPEWLKLKRLTIPNVGESVELSCSQQVGVGNGPTAFEN
jgi:hypothetical protein